MALAVSNPKLVNVMPGLKHPQIVGTAGVRTELRNTNLIRVVEERR